MTTDAILTQNIQTTIRKMKKDGTTGAGIECLKQCVSTRGLMCSVNEYNTRFPIIAKTVANQMHFHIY
jgi:hypothetical protein